MQASAEIRAGEVFPVIPIAQARMVGSQWFMVGYQFAGVLAGMMLSSILAQMLPFILRPFGVEADWGDQWLVSLAILLELTGTVMGYAIGFNLAAKRHGRKFLAGIKARGTPETAAFTYSLEPDAFVVSNGRLTHRVAWPALQEVIRAPEYWLLQVDTITIVLPRRAFGDEAAEREFLSAILERMAPEAHERSSDATGFLAG
jgi:hypothetical protein